MKDLKCSLSSCEHNQAYSCVAKKIEVSNGTTCTSYKENPKKARSLFEVSGEFHTSNYSVDTKVSCKADCIFNKSESCCANGITVLGDNKTRASCATFMKR